MTRGEGMDLYLLIAVLAQLTSTPIPDIWSMTVSDVSKFSRHIPDLAKMQNPLMAAGDEKEKPQITFNGAPAESEEQLVMMLQPFGLKVEKRDPDEPLKIRNPKRA